MQVLVVFVLVSCSHCIAVAVEVAVKNVAEIALVLDWILIDQR